jgi:hypothetical protein
LPVVAEGVPVMAPVFRSRSRPLGREGDTLKRTCLSSWTFTGMMVPICLPTTKIV